MTLQEIINIISTNGIAVIIVAYFVYKDYKFNSQLVSLMDETNKMLSRVSTILDRSVKSDAVQ